MISVGVTMALVVVAFLLLQGDKSQPSSGGKQNQAKVVAKARPPEKTSRQVTPPPAISADSEPPLVADEDPTLPTFEPLPPDSTSKHRTLADTEAMPPNVQAYFEQCERFCKDRPDITFAPAGYPMTVGSIGSIPQFHIIQVVDDENAIAEEECQYTVTVLAP